MSFVLEFVCEFITAAIVLGTVGWSVVFALREGRRTAVGRWGHVEVGERRVGDGAYRAKVHSLHRPRSIPWLVWLAGVTGLALSTVMPFVLTPVMGAVAMAGATQPFHTPSTYVPLIALFAVATSPLTSFYVFMASRGLVRGERMVGPRARRAGQIASAVGAFFFAALVLTAARHDARLTLACVLVGAGALHGVLLWAAGRRAEAIQVELSGEEWDALPLES